MPLPEKVVLIFHRDEVLVHTKRDSGDGCVVREEFTLGKLVRRGSAFEMKTLDGTISGRPFAVIGVALDRHFERPSILDEEEEEEERADGDDGEDEDDDDWEEDEDEEDWEEDEDEEDDEDEDDDEDDDIEDGGSYR